MAKELGYEPPVIGGWMYSLASVIVKEGQVALGIASIYKGKEIIHKKINSIDYFLIPSKFNNSRYEKKMEAYWKKIVNDFEPSIVHLHGSEFYHSLSFIRACPSIKKVISIQGMVSVCEKYYYGGIPYADLIKNTTIIEIMRRSSLFEKKRKMKKRGEGECEMIKKVNHIIGRTRWDEYHVKTINPKAKYHFCNEILRKPFYCNRWKYSQCKPHRIFISQAGYPIKGLHQVIKAFPIVLKYYPDAEIIVAGKDIIKNETFKDKLRISGYGKYIRKLINLYKLENKIHFTGFLDEENMCKAYLNSNLFICPSAIENSPNSLGEAQLLGMPCIASYVGGVPDMMKGQEKWLYRFEEYEMLAQLICKAFEIRQPISNLDAKERHSINNTYQSIINIYNSINIDDN